MPIPFFHTEDNLTALRKMKVIFLIRRIRTIDFCILGTWIMPFILNVIVFNLMKGGNELWKMFCPFGSMFREVSGVSMADWAEWYGALHICALVLTVFARVAAAVNLKGRMQKYQEANPGFKWNTRDKFWLVVCLPFVSFVIYPILIKLTQFELVHKYNL